MATLELTVTSDPRVVDGRYAEQVLLRGRVTEVSGRGRVHALGTEFVATGPDDLSGAVMLMLRPEALAVAGEGGVVGTVRERRFTGAHDILLVDMGGTAIEVAAAPQRALPGSAIRLLPTGVGAHAFAPRTSRS